MVTNEVLGVFLMSCSGALQGAYILRCAVAAQPSGLPGCAAAVRAPGQGPPGAELAWLSATASKLPCSIWPARAGHYALWGSQARHSPAPQLARLAVWRLKNNIAKV